MKIGVTVADAMNRKPVTVETNEDLKSCAEKMQQYKADSLIVMDKNRIAGIITEQDFVNKVIANGLNVSSLVAKDIMSRKLITINPNNDVYSALKLLQKKDIKQLPVISKRKLVGLLSLKDILKLQPQLFDLWVEKYIGNRGGKGNIEGYCEICNKYSILDNIDGQLVCRRCNGYI